MKTIIILIVYIAFSQFVPVFAIEQDKQHPLTTAENAKNRLQADIAINRQPLRICIGANSRFINSFNGRSMIHDILMKLADLFAATTNNVPLPAGAVPESITIRYYGHCPAIVDAYNGTSTQNFFAHYSYSIEYRNKFGGFDTVQPRYLDINQTLPYTASKPKIELTPLKLTLGLGGIFRDSFNNNSSLSILSRLDLSRRTLPVDSVMPGGPLAEGAAANLNLRPTVLFVCLSGAADSSNCFNQVLPPVPFVGQCRMQAVPDKQILEPARPVNVNINAGGTFEGSFDNSGSLTVLVNEFLDRLTEKMNPSILAKVEQLYFGMGGEEITNSFNGR